MIKSFRDKDTERIWNRDPSKRLSAELQRTTLRKLVAIDGAEALQVFGYRPATGWKSCQGAVTVK